MEKTKDYPLLKSGEFKVEKVVALNFFDLTGERAKTKGSSAKQYHAELHLSKQNNSAQIYTMWGATGEYQTEDWRHYDDKVRAEKEFTSIIKSKLRKGYKEIDIAQRAYGSDEAKKITKSVVLKNVDSDSVPKSNLHLETQRLVSELMGSTNNFVIKTLKCPLGQLSNDQIDKGRDILDKAKAILNKNKNINSNSKQYKDIENLTNDFYSLIPHNLGSGSRGKLEHLLFDDINKIVQKEDDLDTLLDAKAIGASLTSSVDDQYKSLNTNFNFIDHKSELFKWLVSMLKDTKASNHYYFKNIKLLNAWNISRNSEFPSFIRASENIANVCGKQVVPSVLSSLVKNRFDVDKEYADLYKKANILPLFHGSRTQNITGILSKGLLIRPAGVILTGAMYGNGLYLASQSTKSINYTSISQSYWSQGSDDKAYLFIVDAALGNQKIASGSYQYSEKNIAPHHSVWAQGGKSGVYNDEFMIYNTRQHTFKYLLEFSCK